MTAEEAKIPDLEGDNESPLLVTFRFYLDHLKNKCTVPQQFIPVVKDKFINNPNVYFQEQLGLNVVYFQR